MDIAALLELLERFAAPQVQLDPARCLNARFPRADCARCVDVCPTQAITLRDGRPALAPDACTRCGACLWACPGGAFDEEYLTEARLGTTLSQVEADAVALVCPLRAEQGPHLAEGVSVQTPRCLAALSPAMWIELAEVQPVLWANDSGCAECPLAEALPVIHHAVERANAWLALYGRAGRVRLFSRDRPALAEGAQAVVDGSKPHVQRRALLRGRVGRKTVVNARALPITAHNPVDERLRYELPRERVRLLLLTKEWSPPSAQFVAPEQYGFAHIVVEPERCSLCGWCAGFCPTAALEWRQEGERLRLMFQPLRCLDCAICQEACPTQAVHKAARFPAEYLHDVLLLTEDEARACTRCGRLTAARSGDLCVWCREQPAPSAAQLGVPLDVLFPPSPSDDEGGDGGTKGDT